jgi:predicted transglutaminase-like cysteine proteinase
MSISIVTRRRTLRGGGFWAVFTSIGPLLACAFSLVEPIRPIYDFATPMSLLSAEYAEHLSFSDDVVRIAAAPPDSPIENEARVTQLFGMDTEPVGWGALSEKWRRAKLAIADDLEIVARCHANEPCPASAERLIRLSREGAGRSGRERVGLINRAVDLAISPVSDEVQWGVADHWSSPFETLHSNRGDCEDYAIVKYAVLLEAGVSKDNLRIVILRNILPSEHHATVAVRADAKWLILDNRTLTLVRDLDITRAIPEFVLDENGVRRFVWASRSQRAASSAKALSRRS